MIHVYCKEIDGTWFAAAIENGTVVATTFASYEEDALRHLLKSLPYNVPFQMAEKPTRLSKKVLSALKSIFDGKEVHPEFKLETRYLTDYARKVHKCVASVPAGYVTSYGEVAKTVGGSPRAVGRVMATNPFLLLVPCHRVVRSNLTLGGFGLGTALKREILQREDRGYSKSIKIKVNGKSLSLFPVNFLRKG